MGIITLNDILAVCRDDFKAKYAVLKKEYKATLETNKAQYMPGAPRALADQEAKDKFENDCAALRAEVKEFAKPYFDNLRESEYLKVSKIDVVTLERMKAVSQLPLSAAEIGILQQKFAPKGDEYWEMRMIAELAEKNGLNPMQYLNSAALDVKLDVLSQLETQLDGLLAEYDGEFKYGTEVLLNDSVLLRAENVYTNGWKNADMEDADVARRAYWQLKGKTPVEQGIGLMNLYRNATEGVKRALFYEIAQDDSIIDSGAIRFAGLSDEFELFKSGDYEQYSAARDSMKKVMVATKSEDVEEIAETMAENKFFNVMLKNAAKNNSHVQEYIEGAEH